MVDVGTAHTPVYVPLEIIGKSTKSHLLFFETGCPRIHLVSLLDVGCMTLSAGLCIYSFLERESRQCFWTVAEVI